MSDSLICGQRFRTFNLIDDFSREVLAIEIDTSLPTVRILRVLEQVGEQRGYPKKIRMDNGPEFISHKLAEWAQLHGITLEFIQPGKPTQNSYIERFNSTFREEVLNFYIFKHLQEARNIANEWIFKYNNKRPHEALGNLTPHEFANKHESSNLV